MFELSVARNYLVPRRKQLSVSLIALMSVGVITLVVWLVLVFLSVTEGIERNWLDKLTALHAPLRITPTTAYFDSYYYQIDTISAASGYAAKSIGEKRRAAYTDPYSPDADQEVPADWPQPEGIDLVKEAFRIVGQFPELTAQDYEISGAMMRLQIAKPLPDGTLAHSCLSQVTYLASLEEQNPRLSSLLLSPLANPLHDGARGTSVLLAKNFQDVGVRVGDAGHLVYGAATPSSVQEQRVPIVVAGFYDPGVLAVGNKCVLVPSSITRVINASSPTYSPDKTLSNGIHVWCPHLKQAALFKERLSQAFLAAGLSPYWKIETYQEYDFAKDLLQQFQSDKYLFTLVAAIILIVACCNIISLLVLLVHDKKREIGILQAMGASRGSIALIFGACGAAMGTVSSFLGIGAALLTLRHIDTVVKLLSVLQGHEAFNAVFYGDSLPDRLGADAVLFVLIATPLIALCAGLVPAIKACRLRPSAILRAE
jgi:lipoprotein-releasing system permease protein